MPDDALDLIFETVSDVRKATAMLGTDVSVQGNTLKSVLKKVDEHREDSVKRIDDLKASLTRQIDKVDASIKELNSCSHCRKTANIERAEKDIEEIKLQLNIFMEWCRKEIKDLNTQSLKARVTMFKLTIASLGGGSVVGGVVALSKVFG